MATSKVTGAAGAAVLLIGAGLGTACGGDDDSAPSAVEDVVDGAGGSEGAAGGDAPSTSACDLTSPEVVAEIFSVTVQPGEPMGYVCNYPVEGNDSMTAVSVRSGTLPPGSSWEELRDSYVEIYAVNDVTGLGDRAFAYGDPAEGLVVQTGEELFLVYVLPGTVGGLPEVTAEMTELARRIAEDLGAG